MVKIPYKNNFDLLRLGLALSVCLSHLCQVSGNWSYYSLARFFRSDIAVDCFFVVSGFLIFSSYEHSSGFLSYLNKRIRRIFPAYITVVLLATFCLPLLSNVPSELYFSEKWFHYLFSNLFFLNFLQPDLAGIFSANPIQAINPPLWTIKVEMMFYFSVPLIFLLFTRKNRWLVLFSIYLLSLLYSLLFLKLYQSNNLDIYLSLEKQLPGQLSFFVSGGGLYLYFSFLKQHWWKFLLPSLLFLSLQGPALFPPLYPLTLAITVVSFAVCLPFLGNWGKFGDISYGVYIYHFPIIQIFTALDLFTNGPWTAFCLLILAILVTATLSYHLIERPFLRKSSHYRMASEEKSD